MTDILDDPKKQRIIEWHKGFTKGTSDPLFQEYIMMTEINWSWDDIYNIPEREYLGTHKILQIKSMKQNSEMRKVK